MRKPDPLYAAFRGREVRVRHDVPTLGPLRPVASLLRAAVNFATDVDGRRGAFASTVRDLYGIQVSDGGSEVRLRRRA